MNWQKKSFISFLLILISLPMGSATLGHALPPQNVELIRFNLVSLNNAVRIEWETATELETVGYKIRRGALPTNYEDLPDIGIVSSEGSPALGAEYAVVDNTAVNGTTYYYQLIEIESNLTENAIANGSIVPGVQPTPTPTGIAINNGSPTNTPPPAQPTNTPTPTQTPTAVSVLTLTPTPTAASNGRTTATPTSAATATPTSSPTPTSLPIQNQSTNTPIPTPTNSVENDITVYAQGEDQTGYPGPAPTLPPSDAAYPNGSPTSPPPVSDAPPTPYPALTNTPITTNIPVIGSQGESPETGESTADSTTGSDSGTSGLGLLWIGFIIAFLIFAAGVVGSIYFFARKQET